MRLSKQARWRTLALATVLMIASLTSSIANEARSFDLEAGRAAKTLKQFAKQSGLGIVFDSRSLKDVYTEDVVGLMIPSNALARMLENTSLVFDQDDETGAFAVTRSKVSIAELTTQGSEVQTPESEQKPENTTPMKIKKKTIGGLFKGLLALAAAAAASPNLSAQDDSDGDGVYQLSPFSVDASGDIGYRATSTLAGTRINTELRDIGSAVSVLTKELFEDTGATDASTILSYALNVDVGGDQGNFAGGSDTIRIDTDSQRINPQNGQRVRGLASATLTRNYFLTDIPFDDYNTELITINRGPNALLFGVGSPGGVIDNSTKRAVIGNDFGSVSVRFGERSSHRATVDFNRELIEGRLAVRVSALNQENNFQQKPAFEISKREYAAFESVLFKGQESGIFGRTLFSGNIEEGSIHGTPVNVIPQTDGLTSWFSTPDPALQNQPGVRTFPAWVTDGSFTPKFTLDTRPGLNEIAINNSVGSITVPFYLRIGLIYADGGTDQPVGAYPDSSINAIWGRTIYNQAADGRNRFDLYGTTPFIGSLLGWMPGFNTPVIQDKNILDNENLLITGTTNQVMRDFDTSTFTLQQEFFGGKGGLEIGYDNQRTQTNYRLPFTAENRGSDIMIDIAEFLADDTQNPNLGRPYIRTWRVDNSVRFSDRESSRATAFYKLDFSEREDRIKWLGDHVFTGFYSTQSIETEGRDFRGRWISDDLDTKEILIGNLGFGRRDVQIQAYLGDSLLGSSINSASDIRLTKPLNIEYPVEGEFGGEHYNARYWDIRDRQFHDGEFQFKDVLLNGNINLQEIDSEALSWQSYFLGGDIVGLMGWRNDSTTSFERVGNAKLSNGTFDPGNITLTDDPTFSSSGNTFTWSLVGHFNEERFFELPFGADLSFHYNSSENFSPASIRRNVIGESLAPPSGLTEEKGFSVELFERRLGIRFNWFDTTSSNGTFDAGVGQAFTTIERAIRNYDEANTVLEMPIEEALSFSGPNNQGRFSSYEEVYTALRGVLPPDLLALRDPHLENGLVVFNPVNGLTSTTDFVAEGFEIDIVGSITPNWRIALNVGKQETVQSNTAPAAADVVTQLKANLDAANLNDLNIQPHLLSANTSSQLRTAWDNSLFVNVANARNKDGTLSTEQRKWRWNLVTTYSFDEGVLKGFSVGGGARWQDKAAIGYGLTIEDGLVLSDLSRPFFGDEQFNGDLWLGYSRSLNNRIDWKIQLNNRNAFGDSGYIPVSINPDGRVSVVRNGNPKEFFLTNTFSF